MVVQQNALSGQVEIFAAIDLRPVDGVAQRAQPLEIVAQYRVLDPQQIVARIPDRRQFDKGFLGIPGFVGVDHDL